MDPYIKTFNIEKIDTEILQNCNEGNQVLNINNIFTNFKLLHNNIRSINKNLDEFKTYLQQFDFNYDFIILTETWEIIDLDSHQINGYNLIYNNGNYNQNDGTVIYIKTHIDFKYNILMIGNNNLIEVETSIANKSIKILCFYRSPAIDIQEFNDDLKTFLSSYNSTADYCLFIGDINIDILKSTTDSDEYLTTMNEYGFISAINDYTRVKENNSNTEASVSNDYKKTIKQINLKKLKLRLNQVNWNDIYYTTDVNNATNKFIDIIKNNINSCTITIKIKHDKLKRSNWITNGIINSINKRDAMYQTLLNEPNN
ncbi:hypothetical protein NQ317_010176, partial [Molorchus minor]